MALYKANMSVFSNTLILKGSLHGRFIYKEGINILSIRQVSDIKALGRYKNKTKKKFDYPFDSNNTLGVKLTLQEIQSIHIRLKVFDFRPMGPCRGY